MGFQGSRIVRIQLFSQFRVYIFGVSGFRVGVWGLGCRLQGVKLKLL